MCGLEGDCCRNLKFGFYNTGYTKYQALNISSNPSFDIFDWVAVCILVRHKNYFLYLTNSLSGSTFLLPLPLPVGLPPVTKLVEGVGLEHHTLRFLMLFGCWNDPKVYWMVFFAYESMLVAVTIQNLIYRNYIAHLPTLE